MASEHNLSKTEITDIGNRLVNIASGREPEVPPEDFNTEVKRLAAVFEPQGATCTIIISCFLEMARTRGEDAVYWSARVQQQLAEG